MSKKHVNVLRHTGKGDTFEKPEHSCSETLWREAVILELINCVLDDQEIKAATI